MVQVLVRGKHRYYSLKGPQVASVLEGPSLLVGDSRSRFVPSTPSRLRAAHTCYDHMAGALTDRFPTFGKSSKPLIT